MKKWKIGFLVLAGLNLLLLLIVSTFLLIPSKVPSGEIIGEEVKKDGTVPFLIRTQKDSLTNLVNHYLAEETGQENLQYRVEFEDKVVVYGVIKAFNKDIDMKLILEPNVKSNGNVRLLVNELSIGQLKLPVSYVLKYMNTYYDIPEYVLIDSSEKIIDIHLNELTFKNGLSAKAESFNLENDDITFTLYVPLP